MVNFLIHFLNWNISARTNNLSDIKTIHLNIKVLKTPSLDNQVQKPDWLDSVCGKHHPDFSQNNPFPVKRTQNWVPIGQITNRKKVIKCSCFDTAPGFLRNWTLQRKKKIRNFKTNDWKTIGQLKSEWNSNELNRVKSNPVASTRPLFRCPITDRVRRDAGVRRVYGSNTYSKPSAKRQKKKKKNM